MLVTEHFQAEVGGHGGHDPQQSPRITFRYERKRAIDFGANLPANACKVLGIAFTTAVGILIRSREKGLLEGPDAIAKLALLAKHGRYRHSIIEDARLKLEAKP